MISKPRTKRLPSGSRRARSVLALAATACLALAGAGSVIAQDNDGREAGRTGSLLDHSYRPLAGEAPVDLAERYGGKVLLVVNTASKCGFTPQFEALEAMHARYGARGFAVLGFPSGDFKDQEFDDEDKIREFCTLTYGVKFPMFEKVHVVGDAATPLYRELAAVAGEAPAWNFHKYLVGRDGKLLASWGSRTVPDDPAIIAAVEAAL